MLQKPMEDKGSQILNYLVCVFSKREKNPPKKKITSPIIYLCFVHVCRFAIFGPMEQKFVKFREIFISGRL